MAVLPELPADVQRRLDLKWRELVEKWGFDGAHARWHDHRNPNYDEFLVEGIGVTPTIALAAARFKDLAQLFLQVWAQQENARWELFGEWLEAIQQSVRTDIARLWKLLGDWHSAWYDRACRKKVEDALAALVKEWASKSCTFERQQLENPMRSLADLFAARGDANRAFTLQTRRQLYQRAEEVLQADRTSQEQIELEARHCSDSKPPRVDLNALLADLQQQRDENVAEVHKMIDQISSKLRVSSADARSPVIRSKPIQALAATSATPPPPQPEEPTPQRQPPDTRKYNTGPVRDTETANRVAEIVQRLSRESPWGKNLDAICDALDEEKVPCPKTWNKKGYSNWFDCLLSDRGRVKKAIGHHLLNARGGIPKNSL